MMKNIIWHIGLALLAVSLFSNDAKAQWQTPNHSVPVGRGTGTGFNSVGPCGINVPIVGNGLSADPICSTAGVFTGFANPTASVGLSAVNGSATTAMRSDGAPPLNQSISPTWTGTHTFSIIPVLPAQSANTVYAGPSSGGSATPGFRALVTTDIPSAALSSVNDSNVTATLSGTPASALLAGTTITMGWQNQLSVGRGGTGLSNFAANLPLLGNGSSALTQGTISGNTTQFATVGGTKTSDHCAAWDSAGNLVSAGPCINGGALPSSDLIADHTITTGEISTIFNNRGAVGTPVVATLPSCTIGVYYEGFVAASADLTFQAIGTDIIYLGTTASSAGGGITSSTIGSKVRLVCEGSGIWSAISSGNWTVN